MKKYLSRAVRLVLFIAGLCVIYAGFDYIISDDTNSLSRVTLHDFYEEGEIDYLFLGPSHSLRSINAVQLSEELDTSVFNVSTMNQEFVGTYYIIKEAVNSRQINHIFCEVSVSRFKYKDVPETSTYIISDYMKSPLIRTEYLLSTLDSKKYVNAFFRLRRNIDPQNLPEWEELAEIYHKKRDADYSQYVGTERYWGKGQWADTSSWAYGDTAALNIKSEHINNFTLKEENDKEWEYLQKIIDLCSDKGIDLTFYITPYSELYLMRFEQYQTITQKVYDVMKENNVDVIDFNKIKEEYLNFSLSDFSDADHISSIAGKKLTHFFAQYIENPDGDYFYDSMEGKYPLNDEIKAVAFERFFVTDQGESTKKKKVNGTIKSLRLDISALSWIERPVNVRMWTATKSQDDESVWIDGDEIMGEKLDDYSARFVVPYNNLKTFYKVGLLDPDTNEILYETYTRFDMD